MKNQKMLMAVFAVLVIAFAGITFLSTTSEDVDADTAAETWPVGVYVPDTLMYNTSGMYIDWTGSVPGMTIRIDHEDSFLHLNDKRRMIISGTPTTPGNYTINIHAHDTLGKNNYHTYYISIYDVIQYVDVIYSATPGLINGQSTWTESVAKGTYASMPTPTAPADGSKSFRGWSLESGGTIITSFTPSANTTLYAVWNTNTVSIVSYSATVTQGQSFLHTFSTNPSNASLQITSYGGLTSSQIGVSGKTLSGTITAEPGTYNVSIKASAGMYNSTTTIVKITVPIVIVPPIEYTVALGDTFSYEPVTNPTNSTISISKVTKGGVNYAHSLTVQGRTITGVMNDLGTVDITFDASASGYTKVSKTVRVFVTEPSTVSNPATIDSITVVPRAEEPRTYDMIAIGVAYATNITWYVNGIEFASSHNTAVYEVMGPGFYEFKATVSGSNNSKDSATKTVVIIETYYPEMAWVGIPYTYIAEGTSSASLSPGSFLTSEIKIADGVSYVVVSGTPTQSHLGNTYNVTIGSTSLYIKVYAAQTEAPDASFILTIQTDEEGNETFTVDTEFTGSNASEVWFDYGVGLGWVSDTSYTYVSDGVYTVRCLAVNNISDRITSDYVIIGVIDGITLDMLHLSDIYVMVGDPVVLDVPIEEGDVITISGTASAFLSVDGNQIKGVPAVSGSYTLSIVVTHSDSTSVNGSILVIVSPKLEQQVTVSFGGILTNNTVKVNKLTSYSVVLKSSGNLPTEKSEISVKIGGVDYTDFIYSSDDGSLFIPAVAVTANIVISYGSDDIDLLITVLIVVCAFVIVLLIVSAIYAAYKKKKRMDARFPKYGKNYNKSKRKNRGNNRNKNKRRSW